MKKTRDKEINALSQLVKILRPLDAPARERAIRYTLLRLEQEDEGTVTTREMTAEDLPRKVDWDKMKAAVGDHTLLSPRKTLAGE